MVVQLRVAARHYQYGALADPQRQGLGDAPRLHAMGLGGQGDGGGAGFQLDDAQVRGFLGEEPPDGFEAHGVGSLAKTHELMQARRGCPAPRAQAKRTQ